MTLRVGDRVTRRPTATAARSSTPSPSDTGTVRRVHGSTVVVAWDSEEQSTLHRSKVIRRMVSPGPAVRYAVRIDRSRGPGPSEVEVFAVSDRGPEIAVYLAVEHLRRVHPGLVPWAIDVVPAADQQRHDGDIASPESMR